MWKGRRTGIEIVSHGETFTLKHPARAYELLGKLCNKHELTKEEALYLLCYLGDSYQDFRESSERWNWDLLFTIITIEIVISRLIYDGELKGRLYPVPTEEEVNKIEASIRAQGY